MRFIIIFLLLTCMVFGAITEKYCTSSGAGSHDGTTEGNAWTLAEADGALVAGERLNIKSDATHTPGAAITFATDSGTGTPIIIRGYDASPGDLDWDTDADLFPEIDMEGNIFTVSGDGIMFQNVYVRGDHNLYVISNTGRDNIYYRTKLWNEGVSDNPHHAIRCTGYASIYFSYLESDGTETTVAGSTSVIGAAISASVPSNIQSCYIDSTRAGIAVTAGFHVMNNNVIDSDSALASHGIYVDGANTGQGVMITNNSIFQDHASNTGDGIHFEEYYEVTDNHIIFVANNIIEGWGSFAIDTVDTETWPLYFINNATYNNGGVADFGDTPIFANIANLALSASPFTDAPNGNFIINNVAGAGAICRGGAVNYALNYGGVDQNDNSVLGPVTPSGDVAKTGIGVGIGR